MAIKAEHGNLMLIAARLGIAKSTLYEKVKHCGASRIVAEDSNSECARRRNDGAPFFLKWLP